MPKSEKQKARQKAWQKSPKGRAAQKRYRSSEKYKTWRKAYAKTPDQVAKRYARKHIRMMTARKCRRKKDERDKLLNKQFEAVLANIQHKISLSEDDVERYIDVIINHPPS
jgi:bisphosphoglycerate-dependent phosphoglycerate mutase